MTRTRYTRNKRRKVTSTWPPGTPSAREVADQARYVGSPEHKNHPSAAGPPRLRTDASKCPPALTGDQTALTDAIQEWILKEAVSADFEGDFPRYVWGHIQDQVFEARHINGPQGTYKGYLLRGPAEWPNDPNNKLNLKKK